VDIAITWDQGGPIHTPTCHGPTLKKGSGQKGSRGQEKNVRSHRTDQITTTSEKLAKLAKKKQRNGTSFLQNEPSVTIKYISFGRFRPQEV
jgi:hypothetical protein